MKEKTQLQVFILFLFIFGSMLFAQVATAFVNVSPVVSGYSSGRFKAAQGTFTMAAANSGYIKPAIAQVAGKSITVPATLRMAVNAGQFAKAGMLSNPGLLALTLAYGWLLEEGLEYTSNQWMEAAAFPYTGSCVTPYTTNYCQKNIECYNASFGYYHMFDCGFNTGPNFGGCGGGHYICFTLSAQKTSVPHPLLNPEIAIPALPDPLPAIAPELPYAPYLPEGVPVDAPDYEFAPFQTPVGDPYTKPDGSTAQPWASVSPNGDTVTVDTYEKPLTDPQGNPVAQPETITDTAEPEPDICEKYPNSVQCANLDTPASDPLQSQERTIALIAPVAVGGAGSCPAPLTASVLGQNLEMSFDPLCQYANSLRPLVLALAWLSAGLIFIGGVRNG